MSQPCTGLCSSYRCHSLVQACVARTARQPYRCHSLVQACVARTGVTTSLVPTPGVWTGFRMPGNLVPRSHEHANLQQTKGQMMSAPKSYSPLWDLKTLKLLGNQRLNQHPMTLFLGLLKMRTQQLVDHYHGGRRPPSINNFLIFHFGGLPHLGEGFRHECNAGS